MGSRLSLVWELGKKGSGGRIALSSSQQDSADFLRTKQSGDRALGEGRPHLLVPQLRMGEVEGAGLLLLLPWCPASPGFFSLTGLEQGQGSSPSSRPGKLLLATVHICADENPSSGSHSPLPAGLIHSLTDHPGQPHCRKTWQRSPPLQEH